MGYELLGIIPLPCALHGPVQSCPSTRPRQVPQAGGLRCSQPPRQHQDSLCTSHCGPGGPAALQEELDRVEPVWELVWESLDAITYDKDVRKEINKDSMQKIKMRDIIVQLDPS